MALKKIYVQNHWPKIDKGNASHFVVNSVHATGVFMCCISMDQCKKNITTLPTYWSYVPFALNHPYKLHQFNQNSPLWGKNVTSGEQDWQCHHTYGEPPVLGWYGAGTRAAQQEAAETTAAQSDRDDAAGRPWWGWYTRSDDPDVLHSVGSQTHGFRQPVTSTCGTGFCSDTGNYAGGKGAAVFGWQGTGHGMTSKVNKNEQSLSVITAFRSVFYMCRISTRTHNNTGGVHLATFSFISQYNFTV